MAFWSMIRRLAEMVLLGGAAVTRHETPWGVKVCHSHRTARDHRAAR